MEQVKNVTASLPDRIEKREVDKILAVISAALLAVNQHIPNTWPEKRNISDKLTEALTWLQVGYDCQVRVELNITPKKAEVSDGPKN